MEKSITIDIENSNRDDDVTVITNLSSVEASYTVVQGTKAHFSAHLTTHTARENNLQKICAISTLMSRGKKHKVCKKSSHKAHS